MKFKGTNKLVEKILLENPLARDSDMYLYIKVVERLNPDASEMGLKDVLLNLNGLGLPCFETVRRTRQKLQSKNADLQASHKVQDWRAALEEEYRKEFGK